MKRAESVTFVVPVSDEEVFRKNFLSSPLFAQNRSHQILEQRHFPSAAKAYNAGIEQAQKELMIFAHQDVCFPEGFLEDLEKGLEYLEREDPEWGAAGCFGVTRDNERWGYVYSNGWGILGKPFDHPRAIQTLDEIVLVLRKSSGLRFDDALPSFHFYGTDICLQAASRGRKSYAISAFCLHNTNQIFYLPREFWSSYRHVKKRWKHVLPIQTPCLRISPFPGDVINLKIREYVMKARGKGRNPALRVEKPQELLRGLMKQGERRP